MANEKNNKPAAAPAQGNQIKAPAKPPKPPKRKDIKIYEFRIYSLSNNYSGEFELLVTTTQRFKDVIEYTGRHVSDAHIQADEYVRSIGSHGLTVEDPKGTFNFYPSHRIAKIIYGKKGEVEDERDPD
jgi:hypothetical protein